MYVLPEGIEYKHEVFAFYSLIYGLKEAVETFRKWCLAHSFLRVARLLGCLFLSMKNNNDVPLVVRVLGTIIAVPVYACMAILMLAIPLLFMGSVIQFLSGRAFESLESFIASLLFLLVTGFILREGFNKYAPWFVEQYEKYFKK